MKYTVSLAYTNAERGEAFGLLKKVYSNEFGLDLEAFKSLFVLPFDTDVLVIRDETGRMAGTASIMFPQEALFPSEYIFGASIREDGYLLPLSQSVEVGRLAKLKEVPNGLIIKAVMLAVAVYLRRRKRAGWVATVKPPLFRILQKKGLETKTFEKYSERTDAAQAEAVKKYKGDRIVSFWASSENTYQAFEALQTPDIEVDLSPMTIHPAMF
jgi:hypothetical protein